jgi:hypothetical protein
MKLADILKIAAPLLAADKKPEDLEALIIAADKKTKDSLPGNVAEAKEIEDRKAKDRKARDEKMMKDRKARDEKRATDRAARDAKRAADRAANDGNWGLGAKDRDDDPEHTNDACDAVMEKEAKDEAKEESDAEDEDYTSGSDPSTPGGNRAGGKTAIDSAEVDKRISAAVAARDALHQARVDVEPILGKVTFDTADAVYREALKQLGVDVTGITGDALPKMLQLAKDRVAAPPPVSPAMDSANLSAIEKVIPGYGRLK